MMSDTPGSDGLQQEGSTPPQFQMPRSLSENDWRILLSRIRAGTCTPFLGAGAAYGVLPLGGAIAQEWATENGYPLDDSTDLIKVSQFMAVEMGDAKYPKEEIAARFKKVAPPDFSSPDEPHGFLADLPLPVYITTNYDDFMLRALHDRGRKPEWDICRWNSRVFNRPSVLDRADYVPSVDRPLVFHLHGQVDVPDSLVLTEDDYLDFLVAISRKEEKLLPPRLQEAMGGASLLFIG